MPEVSCLAAPFEAHNLVPIMRAAVGGGGLLASGPSNRTSIKLTLFVLVRLIQLAPETAQIGALVVGARARQIEE